jgi:hypothetical protein
MIRHKTDRAEKTASDDQDGDNISRPYNVVLKSHVDFNFTWTGQKPEELFELKEELGRG